MMVLRNIVLLCCFGSPLGAQGIGAGYQIARADQEDTRDARGLGIRIQFRGPIELRYDYLSSAGERFDFPCGGFIPPGCVQEPIHYSSDLQGLGAALELSASRLGGTAFGGRIAARARGFALHGPSAPDAYQPYQQMDWIESLEFGVSVALPRR
jgi:hypothetical protein